MILTTTHTRRGNFASFSVSRNDELLRKAIQMMNNQGAKTVDGFIRLVIHEQVEKAKEELKRRAGSLINVKVPKAKGVRNSFRKSRGPIHAVVADALKTHRIKENEYRVHTGKSIREASVGVIGQRGGRLSHIVAKGIDPFSYGKLPMLVMSSAAWYSKVGVAGWVSTGMRMRRQHPGFYNTFDYIGYVDKHSRQRFQEMAPEMVQMLANISGFNTQMRGSSALKSTIGGRGVMRARGG